MYSNTKVQSSRASRSDAIALSHRLSGVARIEMKPEVHVIFVSRVERSTATRPEEAEQ
jgi:hypothetical protein